MWCSIWKLSPPVNQFTNGDGFTLRPVRAWSSKKLCSPVVPSLYTSIPEWLRTKGSASTTPETSCVKVYQNTASRQGIAPKKSPRDHVQYSTCPNASTRRHAVILPSRRQVG
eukprot:Amastigsp_a341299_585.p3 type:complete len:112 gc:universal Amastigsp_a341299_585:298-633(+)